MDGYFSLWDTSSRNIINTYVDPKAALRSASALIASFGDEYADDLELSWTSEDQQSHHVVATGSLLVALAGTQSSERQKLVPRHLAMIRSRRTVSRVQVRQPVAS